MNVAQTQDTETIGAVGFDPSARTLVVGLGQTGLSVARFLAERGTPFAVADSRETPPGLGQFRQDHPNTELAAGAFDAAFFAGFEQIVLSPGIAPATPAVASAVGRGARLLGDIELFALYAEAPVVGITGSNGKSTVTMLVGEMARRAGLDARVGGNIGTPALDLLHGRPDLFVLELSSFQLETTRSLRTVAAAVLNVSADHLDRHAGLQEYAAIKRRLFDGAAMRVVNADDAVVAAMVNREAGVMRFGLRDDDVDFGLRRHEGRSWLTCRGRPFMPLDEMRMAGRQNTANALAALALGEAAGLPHDAMLEALRSFSGLPHRCELVRERGGVRWFNDSKGTNVGATLAALDGVPGGKVVLIAGGEGKGADFVPLRRPVAERARAVVLIGRDAPLLAAALGEAAPLVHAEGMAGAVREADRLAQRGDSVLLSPACASFDMFSGYAERGEAFRREVEALP